MTQTSCVSWEINKNCSNPSQTFDSVNFNFKRGANRHLPLCEMNPVACVSWRIQSTVHTFNGNGMQSEFTTCETRVSSAWSDEQTAWHHPTSRSSNRSSTTCKVPTIHLIDHLYNEKPTTGQWVGKRGKLTQANVLINCHISTVAPIRSTTRTISQLSTRLATAGINQLTFNCWHFR